MYTSQHLHSLPETKAEIKRGNARRIVSEYRIWGEGFTGTLRFLLRLTGTVWTHIYINLIVLTLMTVGAIFFHIYVFELEFPLTGHQVVLLPMSFLFVFRCSNSYQRYWDGRTLLGLLVFHSRELASKGYVFVSSEQSAVHSGVTEDAALIAEAGAIASRIRRYVIASVILINQSVSKYWDQVDARRQHRKRLLKGLDEEGDMEYVFQLEPLREYVTPKEFSELSSVMTNHPILVLVWLRYEVHRAERRGFITPFQSFDLSQSIAELQQVWNSMIKITSTPLPYPWVHLSRVILILFLVTLIPPAVSVLKWGSLPFVVGTAFLFLGLVQIGVEMEDPFGTDINDFDLEAFELSIIQDVDIIRRSHEKRAEWERDRSDDTMDSLPMMHSKDIPGASNDTIYTVAASVATGSSRNATVASYKHLSQTAPTPLNSMQSAPSHRRTMPSGQNPMATTFFSPACINGFDGGDLSGETPLLAECRPPDRQGSIGRLGGRLRGSNSFSALPTGLSGFFSKGSQQQPPPPPQHQHLSQVARSYTPLLPSGTGSPASNAESALLTGSPSPSAMSLMPSFGVSTPPNGTELLPGRSSSRTGRTLEESANQPVEPPHPPPLDPSSKRRSALYL